MSGRLAISTLAFQGMTLEEAAKLCLDNGIKAMEIRMDFHAWSKLSLSDQEYKKIHCFLQEKGIRVSDLGTGVRINHYEKQKFGELERCAQIAGILGCRGLRIMLGNKRKRFSDQAPEINQEEIARWLLNADKIMERYGTQIWIETHNEFAAGRVLRELLNRHDFKHIYLLWDIMHTLEVGEPPEKTLQYMGENLVHVHIKDGSPWNDKDMTSWKYTKIGEGIVPIDDIVKLIISAGYEGYFSLEWESAWRPELQGEEYDIGQMIRQFCQCLEQCEE